MFGSEWFLGVNPDVSGALALLKFGAFGCSSAQVFDSPFVQASVGKRLRRRLDVRSIVQLVQSFDALTGTIAYVEQSTPFPREGKQVQGVTIFLKIISYLVEQLAKDGFLIGLVPHKVTFNHEGACKDT